MYPLIMFGQPFNIYAKCPKWDITNTKTHMFAVIKAILSNQIDLGLIINYIQ